MPRWTPLSIKYCVRLYTTPARIRRRFTISSKSAVNGFSSRLRDSSGSASYGEGTSGSGLSSPSTCGRAGCFSPADVVAGAPADSPPPGADDEQLAVRTSNPTSAAYVRNEVFTNAILSFLPTTAPTRLGRAFDGHETAVPRPSCWRTGLMIAPSWAFAVIETIRPGVVVEVVREGPGSPGGGRRTASQAAEERSLK